ncbi:phospholipase domain-containing protein [Saccharopolyspora hordei]|uniref:phospholipase domain-containing protein n=1 Tax=Saccharopolyspora hordei TaxID=1838 RepID=UPI0031B5B821
MPPAHDHAAAPTPPGRTDRRHPGCSGAAWPRGCASPYRPQVSGALHGEAVALRLGNASASSAHFAVHSGAGAPPSSVDVLGEAVVSVPVRDSYRLAVQGPDRFRFELSGSRTGEAAGVDVQARHTEHGLALELRNDGPQDITLRLRSVGHPGHEEQVRVAAGGAQPLAWPTHRGWYDVEITTPQDTTYRCRVTGRSDDARATG